MVMVMGEVNLPVDSVCGAPAVAVGVRCVIVRRRVQGRLFAAALHRERASFDCVSQE